MKKEIIEKIIAIPLSKWDEWKAELDGVKIVLCPAHTNYSPFVTIDGIDFYGDEITDLKIRLEDYWKEQKNKADSQKLQEIYDKLCHK